MTGNMSVETAMSRDVFADSMIQEVLGQVAESITNQEVIVTEQSITQVQNRVRNVQVQSTF